MQRRNVVLTIYLLFIIYMMGILYIDIRKIVIIDVIVETQLFMFAIKLCVLIVHILIIVFAKLDINKYVKFLRIQTPWIIFFFAIGAELQLIHE